MRRNLAFDAVENAVSSMVEGHGVLHFRVSRLLCAGDRKPNWLIADVEREIEVLASRNRENAVPQ
ncbi:hypothetical protein KZJ38_24370 [Paraburkholderia edwinii]|jgi:hypothetical protein|uniref:Uncharacterized protein n=1 Tax=Paraburkholderia edwinii TaxID=2861782 RepID=A0ABX8UUZ0_9BURK|nr:hypothetical protein [Paraburkholderia edwinii]QYD72828.1 hypothetical protein KZJ38_24370 [Paraburkholderia edwinii]